MVKEFDIRKHLLPIILSLILIVVYFAFDTKYLAAAFVLAFGGFLSLIDMRLAIFAVTFVMPFLPNTLGLLAMLGVGFVYFVRRIFVEKGKISHGIFSGIIALYLLVVTIQTVTSMDFMGSLRDLGLHVGALAYVFAVVNTIKTKKDLNYLIVILLASVTFVALIGVLQTFTGVEIRREWLDVESNPDVRVRVYSVFGNPNTLAEYLVLFTPLAMGMFWHTKNFKKKIVFGGAVGLILICLIFTMSRGGWVGLAMAALVYCILVDKRLLLLSIPMVLAALIILPDTIMNRILSIGNLADSSTAHRFNILSVTWELISDYPVAGVGFGHLPFKEVYETYSRSVNAYHAHNSYIQTIAEIGFAGFLVFITMLITFIKHPINVLLNQPKYKVQDDYLKFVGVGVVAGIIGVFTHGIAENVLYLPKIIFSFWTLVGIGAVAVNISQRETPKIVEEDGNIYKILRSSEVDG